MSTVGKDGKKKDRRTTKTIWIGERREADRAILQHLESLERHVVGLPDESVWQHPFKDLRERFLLEAPITSDARRRDLERMLLKCEAELRLANCGDLRQVGKLNAGLQRLSKSESVLYLVERVQAPLKQISRWATENGVFPFDPLSAWKRLSKAAYNPQRRRSYLPEEAREIFQASRDLDEFYGRDNPLTPIFKTILLTGNRPGVLLKATVADVNWDYHGEARIVLPPAKGKKRNGVCILPDEFLPEFRGYLRHRKPKPKDPLLPSPTGKLADGINLHRDFMEAVRLAFVRLEWAEVGDLRNQVDPMEVAYVLQKGQIRKVDGRKPRDGKKLRARSRLEQNTLEAAERLKWRIDARLLGRDLYALRKTHVSWARRAGVNPDNVKAQVGHGPADVEERHYLDLVDPGASAQAVYDVLTGKISLESTAQRRRREAQEKVPRKAGRSERKARSA